MKINDVKRNDRIMKSLFGNYRHNSTQKYTGCIKLPSIYSQFSVAITNAWGEPTYTAESFILTQRLRGSNSW